ncbi:MAG: hypothetical protein K0R61_158 [Microvirga sp.]|nr:hypothetical protein [Microvirga sp.]
MREVASHNHFATWRSPSQNQRRKNPSNSIHPNTRVVTAAPIMLRMSLRLLGIALQNAADLFLANIRPSLPGLDRGRRKDQERPERFVTLNYVRRLNDGTRDIHAATTRIQNRELLVLLMRFPFP